MRRLVHLSDLHFGRVDPTLVEPLLEAVKACDPEITAISGDFTQNGTEREFADAAKFIAQLPGRVIAVPGNHDMAFLNPVRRATQRLKLFRAYISNEPEPFYVDDEIAVVGLNTARVTHLRDGRIREWQIRSLEEKMNGLAPEAVRILVTHHPFDLPAVFTRSDIVGRAARYIRRVVCCIDLMLAGHMHISFAGPTALRYDFGGESAIFIQAGTALSTRVRGEENSFQFIQTSSGAIEVQQFISHGSTFRAGERRLFRKETGSWTPAPHAVQVLA
jgi:3',5'-cyclic AMP phosphodiesterase CpdA